jgi:hypothetical protein
MSSQATPKATLSPAASSTPQPPATQSGPDPVIRMLATRAASNPELKALMKVVASSKASQEQLKLFQSHIDELNGILRQQQEAEKSQSQENSPAPPQLDGPSDQNGNAATVQTNGTSGSPQSFYVNQAHHAQPGLPPHQQQTPKKTGPLGPAPYSTQYGHYPQQPKVPMVEPRVTAILLEFNTPASSNIPASQDRYLFPEYAVLDTPISGAGLEMVCSFFVVQKGSELLSMQSSEGAFEGAPIGGLTRWKANEEYYQPVTMTIKTSLHRILETIARAAKPLGEVQDKMKEIMQTKTRVKDEWVVMRLPREKGVNVDNPTTREVGFVNSAVEVDDDEAGSPDEDDELKAFYGI